MRDVFADERQSAVAGAMVLRSASAKFLPRSTSPASPAPPPIAETGRSASRAQSLRAHAGASARLSYARRNRTPALPSRARDGPVRMCYEVLNFVTRGQTADYGASPISTWMHSLISLVPAAWTTMQTVPALACKVRSAPMGVMTCKTVPVGAVATKSRWMLPSLGGLGVSISSGSDQPLVGTEPAASTRTRPVTEALLSCTDSTV